KPRGRLTPRKPVLPGEEELRENKRSHSARLRVIERIDE
ncbi:MAG: 16S rRNA (cytosine(1402)-N(4))-methyltransferase, partial [Clostridiales bacterium]